MSVGLRFRGQINESLSRKRYLTNAGFARGVRAAAPMGLPGRGNVPARARGKEWCGDHCSRYRGGNKGLHAILFVLGGRQITLASMSFLPSLNGLFKLPA